MEYSAFPDKGDADTHLGGVGLSEEQPCEVRPGTGTGEARIQGISQYPPFTTHNLVVYIYI